MSDVPCLASVVIVTYGQRSMTEACLESLQAALGDELGRSFELILVDNASPDDTLELLRAWSDRVTVLEQPFNRNFSGGCNDGARVARGDVLIFLNNDTIVGAGVLEALAETAREPGVGAAGLRLLYPNGLLQHAGMLTVPDREQASLPVPAHMLYRQDGEIPAGRATYELDVVTGACLAMPRAVFEELGGFDEAYINGYEDVDLCLRTRVSGRSVVYRGDLVIEHHESASRKGGNDSPNLQRMLSIWGSMLEADHELAAGTWDVALAEPQDDVRALPATDTVVVGEISGFGPAADEARALILALERAGSPAVGIDFTPIKLRPALSGETGAAAARALARCLPTGPVLRIDVPFGASWARQAPAKVLMRTARTAPDGRTEGLVAATPVAGPAWIPPAIEVSGPVGAGGAGVLVSLPAHDAPAARAVLQGLADAAVAACSIRIVPTVAARGLDALIAELLPDAELLGPCGDEARWAQLAQTADVAVCLDADDLFERRALHAAAAGATVIVGAASGPAEAVLGERAIVAPPAELAVALSRALEIAAADRAAAAQLVRTTCAPELVGQRLLSLIGRGAPAAVAA